MNNFQIKQLAFKVGVIAFIIGAIAFSLSWYVFNGGLPGYRIFLLPGILFMLPFTEELDFGLKIVLLLGGQFLVSAVSTIIFLKGYLYLNPKRK